jgi:hypothetical protein
MVTDYDDTQASPEMFARYGLLEDAAALLLDCSTFVDPGLTDRELDTLSNLLATRGLLLVPEEGRPEGEYLCLTVASCVECHARVAAGDDGHRCVTASPGMEADNCHHLAGEDEMAERASLEGLAL